MGPVLRILVELSQVMRKKMAVGALIAPKPLEIQRHLFYEKIIEI